MIHNSDIIYLLYIDIEYDFLLESDKKNEADGFDQVGTNPCNSKCVFVCIYTNTYVCIRPETFYSTFGFRQLYY